MNKILIILIVLIIVLLIVWFFYAKGSCASTSGLSPDGVITLSITTAEPSEEMNSITKSWEFSQDIFLRYTQTCEGHCRSLSAERPKNMVPTKEQVNRLWSLIHSEIPQNLPPVLHEEEPIQSVRIATFGTIEVKFHMTRFGKKYDWRLFGDKKNLMQNKYFIILEKIRIAFENMFTPPS